MNKIRFTVAIVGLLILSNGCLVRIVHIPAAGEDWGPDNAFMNRNFVRWPPPVPSAQYQSESSYFTTRSCTNLGNAGALLRAKLAAAGYQDVRYFGLPRGVGLITRLERIDETRKSLHQVSVNTNAPVEKGFRQSTYIRELMGAEKPGLFRVMLFMVTKLTIEPQDDDISLLELSKWGRSANRLPDELAALPVTSKHYLQVFVYEFKKYTEESDALAKPVTESDYNGLAHLQITGIWNHLTNDLQVAAGITR